MFCTCWGSTCWGTLQEQIPVNSIYIHYESLINPDHGSQALGIEFHKLPSNVTGVSTKSWAKSTTGARAPCAMLRRKQCMGHFTESLFVTVEYLSSKRTESNEPQAASDEITSKKDSQLPSTEDYGRVVLR